jgi:hypothetical protein
LREGNANRRVTCLPVFAMKTEILKISKSPLDAVSTEMAILMPTEALLDAA